jgi:carbamoyltransferase
MRGGFLGPRSTEDDVAQWVQRHGYAARRYAPHEVAETVASLLAEEKVVALCQGRMEFGPRALGARSIIGDARSPKMQSVMNLKVKFRESFRPFAPAVLREHVHDWFELDCDSPYMLLVADVSPSRRVAVPETAKDLWGIEQLNVPRSTIPAVTHVDGSARVQTVRRGDNPLYYDIIRAFYRRTGCPVIVNTSFNVRGEPIVCTPDDAYRCFMRTNIDALVVENFVLEKADQAASAVDDSWRKEFVLD